MNGETSLSGKDKVLSGIIQYGIIALIIFSPLPAASVYEWSILTIELVVLTLVLCYILIKKKPQPNDALSRSLRWPRYLFTGFFLVILIQIIPWPAFLVRIFSPNTYSYLSRYSTDFARAGFISFSLVPLNTVREGIELLSYVLLAFLILKTVTRRLQLQRLYFALMAMGIFQGFYGLFEIYNKNPRILFYKKTYGLDSSTGTFVNWNHFSGYLEMIIPLAIGLIISRIDVSSRENKSLRQRLLRFSEKGLITNLILTCGVALMSLAVIFSKSRSGIFILAFTFLLFLELMVMFRGKARNKKKGIKKLLTVLSLFIICISLYIGIDTTFVRFSLDKMLQEQRPVVWARTLATFARYPFFGTGLGTFPALYPADEVRGDLVHIYHAHNDYLEYLSELGLVGFGLLIGGILFLCAKSFFRWRLITFPEIRALAAGGIVALVNALIHSLADFSLHIAANLLLFTVVLSLTVVAVFYKGVEVSRAL